MSIKKLFDYSVPMVAAATVLVIGACAVTLYVGKVVYDIKLAGDTVVVTGSAKVPVVADTARWSISLEARTGMYDQEQGFTRLDQATERIVAYLAGEGFTEYEVPPPTTYPVYIYPQYGEPTQTGYTVTRQIVVRSGDVEKLSALAGDVTPFVGDGYNVTTGMLELTYGKLDETRVTLLSDAIKDARERADAIARDSGRSIDTLRSAASGVVQVLPQGGVEISDYGMYDTMSLHKEVMVTVRATFSLK